MVLIQSSIISTSLSYCRKSLFNSSSRMSSKKILVIVSLAVIFGLGAGKSLKGATYAKSKRSLMDFDCSGKEDGNYPHPMLCTHFVACVGGKHAYEMVCALNHDGKPLHFVPSSGPSTKTARCDYPEVAGCDLPEPDDPTTPEPDEPSTTPAEEPTTSEPTTMPTTTMPPTTEPPPECEETEIRKVGNCTYYEVCKDGKWVPSECDKDLFWNSGIENGQGGTCDYYENLSNDIRDEFNNDIECILPSDSWQTESEKCTGTYHFREPYDGINNEDREKILTCPKSSKGSSSPDLVWNPATRTCSKPGTVPGC
ncbi:unnamed protein product [Allacma fusca]|uniref:Chitin-binding type-2 domain-containing protein n=1 Tax=Allacma fusca TaxID=39272 RepID=A0A8J2JS87_9HEXA|nr:unnamed protein product [Allacma fusca]